MALRVAFDLDGTIADMHAVLREHAARLFTRVEPAAADAAASADPDAAVESDDQALTPRQQRQLWAHVQSIDNFWDGLPEIEPGIVARIADLAAARRWETIFLTTRPTVKGDTTQVQSQRWLHAHGFPRPSVFVVRGSRGKIADALALDAVVDDRKENCVDVAIDSTARPILVWRGDVKAAPAGADSLGVLLVRSMAEALDALVKLDAVKAEPGVMGSIKRMFGQEPV